MAKDLNIDFNLKSCLFGAVKLIKNTDLDKYSYSGYGIGFDSRSLSSFPNFNWGKNVAAFFGVDNSSSVYIDNKKKYILVVGESATQELDHQKKRSRFHYYRNNSFFVHATKMHQLKAKTYLK